MTSLVLSLLLTTFAQTKELPEYDWWANCKVGSWVKVRMESDQGGNKTTIDFTQTLAELTPEKAVVERKVALTTNGVAAPESTHKQTHEAGKDLNSTVIEKEGDEEVEIAGKKLKCHYIQGSQNNGMKIRFWLSKEIPGGVAKGEMTPAGLNPMKITTLSWEKK